MGKYQKGILGHFDGLVGTVIGARWKGVQYMKSRNRKSTKPPTLAQQVQQAKFGLMARFCSRFGDLMQNTFFDENDAMTGGNLGLRLNLQQAIAGDFPAFEIDYPNVLVAQGKLHNVFTPTVDAVGNGTLKFAWTANEGPGAAASDTSVLVAYCPELQQGIYGSGQTRITGDAELLALNFTGKLVHTWMFMRNAAGKVSSSLYCGSATVA
jgi:Family of unknown function (DUF6266)